MLSSEFNIADFFAEKEDVVHYKSSADRQTPDRSLIFSDSKYRYILIPNTNAKYLLANFYKQKYGIEIYVLSDPDKLNNFIQALKKTNDHIQVGIILSCGEGRHSIPIVYEKNDEGEHLIVMDSRGYKGAYNFGIDKIDEMVNSNQSRTIKVYANGFNNDITAIRQADFHSCHNDAFLVLKEALQSQSVVSELREVQPAHYQSSPHYSFLLPEKWSKTVQVSDYLSDKGTKADPDVIVSKKGESLSVFRKRHTRSLQREEIITNISSPKENRGDKTGNVKNKEMNVYLKMKGYENVEKVRQQFLQHHQNLETIYEDRSGEEILNKNKKTQCNTM